MQGGKRDSFLDVGGLGHGSKNGDGFIDISFNAKINDAPINNSLLLFWGKNPSCLNKEEIIANIICMDYFLLHRSKKLLSIII